MIPLNGGISNGCWPKVSIVALDTGTTLGPSQNRYIPTTVCEGDSRLRLYYKNHLMGQNRMMVVHQTFRSRYVDRILRYPIRFTSWRGSLVVTKRDHLRAWGSIWL